MEFLEEVKDYKGKIEKAFKECLEVEKKKAAVIDSSNLQIMDFIMDFCLRGGKRIRAILLVKGYEAVNGSNISEIIKTSICMEFMEAGLLIHDDIIDEDPIRRGGPSFHELAGKWKNDSRFGLSSAIIAGDLLFNLGVRVLLNSNFNRKTKLLASEEYITALLNCFNGELYDVVLEDKEKVSEKDFFKMIDLKTASYTTEAPLVIGAILGGGSEKQVEDFRKYGRILGEAFQLTDDILGVFGKEDKLGKPVDSDIKQGKKTFLSIYALQKANPKDKEFLQKAIGNKNLTPQDLEEVRQIFIKVGALDETRNRAKILGNKAKRMLKKGHFSSNSVKFLSALTDYIVEREL